MSREEIYKAKDKKTHKMTRDGLLETNHSTGEESRISQRGQDFQLTQKSQGGLDGSRLRHDSSDRRQPLPEALQSFKTADAQPKQHGTKYAQKFSKEADSIITDESCIL